MYWIWPINSLHTLILRFVRSLLDVNVQLQFMRNIPFDLNAYAQSDEGGQAAVWHSGVELNPYHVYIVRSGLLHKDPTLVHHVQIFQSLRFLGISNCAQVI